MKTGCFMDMSHPARLCMWATWFQRAYIPSRGMFYKPNALWGILHHYQPRPFRNSSINSMWPETEETEEMGYVDEWTQTFTDLKMFGLAVYRKIKQQKIFIAEPCRGSPDTEITIYLYVKQVLWGTQEDSRKIWRWFLNLLEENQTEKCGTDTSTNHTLPWWQADTDFSDGLFGYTFFGYTCASVS